MSEMYECSRCCLFQWVIEVWISKICCDLPFIVNGNTKFELELANSTEDSRRNSKFYVSTATYMDCVMCRVWVPSAEPIQAQDFTTDVEDLLGSNRTSLLVRYSCTKLLHLCVYIVQT